MEKFLKSQLYKAIDEVIHYLWDPIGVSDAPQARDEYYTYSLHVYKLVKENADEKTIAEYLYNTEKETMGLKPSMDRCKHIAYIINDWKDCLKDK